MCGGGFEALILDGGVLVKVLELLVGGFLYGDVFGRTVTNFRSIFVQFYSDILMKKLKRTN